MRRAINSGGLGDWADPSCTPGAPGCVPHWYCYIPLMATPDCIQSFGAGVKEGASDIVSPITGTIGAAVGGAVSGSAEGIVSGINQAAASGDSSGNGGGGTTLGTGSLILLGFLGLGVLMVFMGGRR